MAGSVSDRGAERKGRIRAFFDSLVTDYDAAGPGIFAHFGRRLVEVAGVQPGFRVLDVATGRGAVLFPAAARAGTTGEAIGVDLAEGMARATTDEAARLGVPITVRVMDAERLAFPDGTFDRVLCGFGVMFFPNAAGAVGEFRRVLRPEGRLAVSTWRVSQAEDLAAVLAGLGQADPPEPGWITEPERLSRLLQEAGCRDVQVVVDTHTFRFADLESYWQTARGTGLRRRLDLLDGAQAVRAREALAERLRPHRQADGYHIQAEALLATAAP